MANRFCNLDGSRKIKDEYPKINEGFDGVERELDALVGASRSATVVVAANNSSAKSKAGADFVVPDGAIADETIKQAINTIPSTGGEVRLLGGKYSMSEDISLKSHITLTGEGSSTILHYEHLNDGGLVLPDSSTHIILRNFKITSNEYDDGGVLSIGGKNHIIESIMMDIHEDTIYTGVTAKNIIIQNNILFTDYDRTAMFRGESIIINNNHIKGGALDGVELYGLHASIIHNNVIDSQVYVQLNSSRNSIQGNMVRNDGGYYGVNISSSQASHNIVAHNNLYDTLGFVDQGIGTVTWGGNMS